MRLPAALALSIILLASPSTSLAEPKKPRCTSEKVAGLLREFIDEFNEGDTERLDQIFAPDDEFGMYRVAVEREANPGGLSLGPMPAADRSSLMAYFETRHEKGDLFSSLLLDGPDRLPNYEGRRFGFGLKVHRETSDSMPRSRSGWFEGKGGADCRYIYAWNKTRVILQ